MHRYVVSFQLGDDPGRKAREARLVAELKQTSSEIPWLEGECLAFVQSWLGIADFADWIFFGAGLDTMRDRLLVIDPAESSAVALGPFDYPNRLAGHFNNCLVGPRDLPAQRSADTSGWKQAPADPETSGQRSEEVVQ